MTESGPEARTFIASDGYPLHVAVWRPGGPPKGQIVILHGVQSHSGWYHRLGRTLASAGYAVSFPDRRGSGANSRERGHAGSWRRLVRDLVEWLESLRQAEPGLPIVVAGISWGAKLAVILAARHAQLVDAIAFICPGLHPRVGVSLRERLAIAWAVLTNRRKMFPIPLSDPALFTASPAGQAFIAGDALSLREATASLLTASVIIDLLVARAPARISQPALLMLAGHDRIADNVRTLAYFRHLASADSLVIEYPEGHHTLEFEPDPSKYALDLARWADRHLQRAGVREG